MEPELVADQGCAFMVEKRGRRCRMTAAKGSIYCGEHLIYDTTHQRSRIPCPLDSSHSIFEDQLARHVKRCNAAKRSRPPCYSPGINCGLVGNEELEKPLPLSEYPEARLKELIERVNKAYERCLANNDIHECILHHTSLEADLCDPNNGPTALKHLTQQASIIGHVDSLGLLSPVDTAYIEFGSGRGKLSMCIQHALQGRGVTQPGSPSTANVHFVLVDRSSCRRKVDGSLRTSSLVGVSYHRLLMDIEDLDLRAVDVLGSGVEQVVVVSKHLCGAATDLGLRCLINRQFSSSPRLSGVFIALCCHHRCTWGGLVGKEYLTELGFTSADFHMISHMTSWAVCGVRPDKPGSREEASGDVSHRTGYVPHPNESIGLKCKRLIDFARLDYLRRHGLTARLVYYVNRETSLENVLLIAT